MTGTLRRIVLVDESPTTQKLVRLCFSSESDLKLHSFSNATSALDFLQGKQVDVLLLQLSLPDMDAYRFCQKVQEDSQMARLPIILLVGAFETVDRKRFRKAGCDSVLFKPLDTQQLANLVQNALDSRVPVTLKLACGKNTPPETNRLVNRLDLHRGDHPLQEESLLFRLDPEQCRKAFSPLRSHSQKAFHKSQNQRSDLAPTDQKEITALVEKVLNRLPAELRRLVQAIVTEPVDS